MTPNTLGVSMIVKNGMLTLPRLLDQLDDLWNDGRLHQVVIVDTGSTDGTLEHLREWAEKRETTHIIHPMEWTGRFDDARNVALSRATTEWVMWLDADDELELVCPYALTPESLPRIDALYVTYQYKIDELGNPVTVQKRERIIRNPKNWVWKNPVHEVVEYVGEGIPCFADYVKVIVKHKPIRDESYSDRNYKILTNQWFRHKYAIGPFMCFYLMKEAYARKEYMLADLVAQAIIDDIFDNPVLPFHKYEAYLTKARIYGALGWQHMEVASRYINAIKLIPELNEAKVEYIMWLVSTGKHVVAQEMVHQLNEVPPETVGVVDTSLYGSHVHALRAFVYMQGGGNVTSVLSDLLQALNYPVVSALCHSVDAWVRKKVAYDRIGIVYAQTDLYEIGKAVASKLERSDVFSNVAVFVNPLAANYANGVYFHIGDQSTWYKEETDPYTTKVLISPEQPDGTMAFGWDYTFVVDPQGTDFSAFIEEVYEHVFGQWATVPASTLQDGLDLMKMVTEQYVAVHHSDQTVSPEEWKRITDILTNHPNDIVAINECPSSGFVGKRELLLKHGVRLPNIYDWVIHTEADAQEFTNEAVPPNPKFPQKRVYIYAEGVEPWDGTTPYRVGIGASEASVVYLAEELAKMHKVYVFSPTTYVHEIDGVTYIPNTEFGSYPCPDVLISSRCPHILIKRYAPVQLLWLHDLYEHTAFPEECVFDKLICVSPGEQRKAENDWGYKAIVIPNPYKPNTTPHNPVYGRCIWLSSPDRGIANLLRSEIATQDLWLTYSYFNARVMRAHDPIQFRRIWEEKYKLRTAGVKLVGRLGLYELRRLLSTCDIWPYASTFKETFCVAALEAIGAGLYPIYSCAGATMGTVQRYTSSVWHDLDDADEVLDELENIQDYDYRQGCNREISPAVFPENVCIQWLRIIQ